MSRSGFTTAKLALFLLVVLPLVASCTMHGDYTVVIQEEATGLAGEIYGTKTVGETFLVSRNNLARIDLPIHTYDRPNHYPLILHLVEVSEEQPVSSHSLREVATVELRPESINRNGYTRVNFPPIPDSAGKRYYLYLESPDSTPGDAMSVYYNVADVYSQGTLVLDGQLAAGDLAFRAYTREVFTPGTVWQDFASRAAGDLAFFLFYGLVLAGVGGALIWTWRLPNGLRATDKKG